MHVLKINEIVITFWIRTMVLVIFLMISRHLLPYFLLFWKPYETSTFELFFVFKKNKKLINIRFIEKSLLNSIRKCIFLLLNWNTCWEFWVKSRHSVRVFIVNKSYNTDVYSAKKIKAGERKKISPHNKCLITCPN